MELTSNHTLGHSPAVDAAFLELDVSVVDATSEFSGKDEVRNWLKAMEEAGIVVVGSDFRVSGTAVTYHSLTGSEDGEGVISGAVVTMTTVVIEDGLIQSLRRR